MKLSQSVQFALSGYLRGKTIVIYPWKELIHGEINVRIDWLINYVPMKIVGADAFLSARKLYSYEDSYDVIQYKHRLI